MSRQHERGLSHEHRHPHDHDRPHGLRGVLHGLVVPHSHDAADTIDDALEASRAGIRALWISLAALLATSLLQLVVVILTASVALLADTVHNFADALTAVPLLIAFALGRRLPTRRYPYGYGRAEDLAGLFIVVVIAMSAVIAGWEAIDRLTHPRPIENPWLLIAAGFIGFAGNELVAIYRIRVGRQIGSAALVADGVHARLDGLISLSVVLGAIGILLGWPLADPIIGLLITVLILFLLWGTIRSVGRRLMDGIEPELLDRAEQALEDAEGVEHVVEVRLRWVGHRLTGSATVVVNQPDLQEATRLAEHAAAHVHTAVHSLDAFLVTPVPTVPSRKADRPHHPEAAPCIRVSRQEPKDRPHHPEATPASTSPVLIRRDRPHHPEAAK